MMNVREMAIRIWISVLIILEGLQLVTSDCPAGWIVSARLGCIKIGTASITFDQAEAACAAEGAGLVMTKSQAEFDEVLSHKNSGVWFGADDRKKEGEWRWRDGSLVTWAKWHSDQPNDQDWNGGEQPGTVGDVMLLFGSVLYDMAPNQYKAIAICQRPSCETCNVASANIGPRDCAEIKICNSTAESGVYGIKMSVGCPAGQTTCCKEVYCDMETFGGGWTGSPQELLVELKEVERECKQFAWYGEFKIGDAASKYRLTVGSYKEGTAGDALQSHNGASYSTDDSDNDAEANKHCAANWRSPWWWSDCEMRVQLNALPLRQGGLTWSTARGTYYKFEESYMKIRPVGFALHNATANSSFCVESELHFHPCPERDCTWAAWSPWTACGPHGSRRSRQGTTPRVNDRAMDCEGRSLYAAEPSSETATCQPEASDTSCNGLGPSQPRDCADILRNDPTLPNGVYLVKPSPTCAGFSQCCRRVRCDMETMGGGWTVFQWRYDGSLDFINKKYDEYVSGFGSPETEHWIGLEVINELTKQEEHDLLFEVRDEGATCTRYGLLPRFWLEHDGIWVWYKAKMEGGKTGNSFIGPGSGVYYGRNRMFGTSEKLYGNQCYGGGGGFWYGSCTQSFINGHYNPGCLKPGENRGISISDIRGFSYGFEEIQMKTRRRSMNVTAAGGGKDRFCSGKDLEVQQCEENNIDCVWNEWSQWYPTSVCEEVGKSLQRNRTIKKEKSHYYGLECQPPSKETVFCNCTSDWSDWSKCSKSCGYGLKQKWRYTDVYCNKIETVFESCEPQPCESRPGFIQDTVHLKDALASWLLDRIPSEEVWLPLLYTRTSLDWTSDGHSPAVPSWLSHRVAPPATLCGVMSSEKNHSTDARISSPAVIRGVNCDETRISWGLCMKDSVMADYRVTPDSRLVPTSQDDILQTTKAESSWFCGLKCRSMDHCVGYNFSPQSDDCELLRVNAATAEFVDRPGGKRMTRGELENQNEWMHSARVYGTL